MTATLAGRTRAPFRTATRARTVQVDLALLGATAGLLLVGCLLVWSATASGPSLRGDRGGLDKQLLDIGIGVVLAVLVGVADHRWLRILAPLVYAGSVLGLVLVLVMGSTVNGSRSWILLGPLSLQPAEFAKLAVVTTMALVAAERTEALRREVRSPEVAGMLGVATVPAVLILLQPDLGTMLVLAATVFGVLAVAGSSPWWLCGLAAGAVGTAVAVVRLGVLEAYQLDRFLAFTDPSLDPRGAGYNTEQARIAIGNGGMWGQGLFQGSQTHSGFVPEQHTDFVFTVAGEELGLVGAGLVVVLLGVLLWRVLLVARRAPDLFGRLAATGVACWLGFQAFQNIGMCLGIMPVTGVPLPLVSSGGSSMFATLAAVGLVHSIHRRTIRSIMVGWN